MRIFPKSVTWEKTREEILKTIKAEGDGVAIIKPFNYEDVSIGRTIAIRTSPYYSILSIGDKEYFFTKETGEFDGVSFSVN